MHPLRKFVTFNAKRKRFLDMGVITKYDQIELISLPQSVVTYIYLQPVYLCV
jgi:hypothetical protein